jgi:predicted GNAT family acetyltransferase
MMLEDMVDIARKQLVTDLNCREEDFINDGVVFCHAKMNEGCRNINRQRPFLEIATMGKGIVVSGDEEVIERIKPFLVGKSREEIFEAPFVYGHSIYYLPDKGIKRLARTYDGFQFLVKEREEITELNEIRGFDNAIEFAEDGSYSTGIVMYAKKGEKIVALAGASIECETMWQIGIDVLPEYRKIGLATYLVNNIAFLIMEKGIVPYYCAASSNIGSQATAFKSGFIPVWMSTYQNAFDGSSSFKELLDIEKIII